MCDSSTEYGELLVEFSPFMLRISASKYGKEVVEFVMLQAMFAFIVTKIPQSFIYHQSPVILNVCVYIFMVF